MTKPPRIRLAVIGLGKIARDRHLPAIAGNDRFELVATVDPQSSGEDLATFASVDDLLESGMPIDAVTIATPPQARERIALRALQAGWHVFLEKPPASTVTGAMRIAHAAESGRTLFSSWHSREAPQVSVARGWLSKRIITGGVIRWRENARQWHPGQHWLWQPGGLGVMDPAINAFSILTEISPERFSVDEISFEVPENQHTPIAVTGTLSGASGKVALDIDFREESLPRWEIELATADGDTLLLSQGGDRLTINGEATKSEPNHEYRRLYARFADLIDGGASAFDLAPLQFVTDAFAVARISRSARFDP